MLAGSAADARAATGSARVYSSTDNPELGRWVLNEATGADPVRMTFTDGLEANRAYFAVLRATDRDGRVFATDVVEARTVPEAVGGVSLFDEASGGSWPADFALSDRNAYRGAACMAWTVSCPSPATSCRQNLKLLGLSATVEVPDGRTPFLELHVRNTGAPSWWSQVNVGLTNGRFFAFGAFTLRQQDGYRRYQLPLSELVDNAGALRDALPGAVVDQVFLNGGWTMPARVNVDAVSVRWW